MFLPWRTGGDGRRCTRLRFRWEGEDGRFLWFGSSLALVWSSNDWFIRNMEFIPLKNWMPRVVLIFAEEGGFRNEWAFSQRRPLFVAHFAVVKWGYCAAKWHSCAKGVFRSHFTAAKWGFGCENWRFHALGISQPFCSCEMRVKGLRNGTRVPRGGFATTKIFVEGGMGLRNDFAARAIFTEASFFCEISQTMNFPLVLNSFLAPRDLSSFSLQFLLH